MKHRKLGNLVIEKSELLTICDEIDKVIKASVLPALNDLQKETQGKKVIAEHVTFTSLNLKDDSEYFKRLMSVVSKYEKILPTLKIKITETYPDTVTTGTSNVNVRIGLSLISEGIFFSENLMEILAYIIQKFYTKSDTELDSSTIRYLGQKLILLNRLLPELEKANIDKVVDVIGEVPAIKTLKHESTTYIPSDVVMGFLGDMFKIKDFYTQTLVKRFLGYFNFKDEKKRHPDIAKTFIGNPIYHLRLFLVDLELLKLESLKEKRRLLELRLLELKSSGNPDDGKLKKQISYYEDQLNKLDLKIDKLIHQV